MFKSVEQVACREFCVKIMSEIGRVYLAVHIGYVNGEQRNSRWSRLLSLGGKRFNPIFDVAHSACPFASRAHRGCASKFGTAMVPEALDKTPTSRT